MAEHHEIGLAIIGVNGRAQEHIGEGQVARQRPSCDKPLEMRYLRATQCSPCSCELSEACHRVSVWQSLGQEPLAEPDWGATLGAKFDIGDLGCRDGDVLALVVGKPQS